MAKSTDVKSEIDEILSQDSRDKIFQDRCSACGEALPKNHIDKDPCPYCKSPTNAKRLK